MSTGMLRAQLVLQDHERAVDVGGTMLSDVHMTKVRRSSKVLKWVGFGFLRATSMNFVSGLLPIPIGVVGALCAVSRSQTCSISPFLFFWLA